MTVEEVIKWVVEEGMMEEVVVYKTEEEEKVEALFVGVEAGKVTEEMGVAMK